MTRHVSWCRELLKKCVNVSSLYANSIIKGDKTWLYYFDAPTKVQNKVWNFKGGSTPMSVSKSRCIKKMMLAVFFTVKGAVNHAALSAPIIRNILDYNPYNPDLAPCDFAFFLHVKIRLKVKRFFCDDREDKQKIAEGTDQDFPAVLKSNFLDISVDAMMIKSLFTPLEGRKARGGYFENAEGKPGRNAHDIYFIMNQICKLWKVDRITEESGMQRMTEAPVVNGAFVWILLLLALHHDDSVDPLKDAMRGLAVPRTEEVIIAPIDNSCTTRTFFHRLEQTDKIHRGILALPRQPAPTMSHRKK
ncbi:hypothetical protein LAZ67_X003545 [Cordylochernes scorpioides]|uniref:Transposase n=1 Tax=Cordylochernes scorpioides TaxID=51811 RepID=A0ABY6LZ24_9ARAC|nr:hypothetical protein LAZ67_X003545 [Cordylochernes scorpioides]